MNPDSSNPFLNEAPKKEQSIWVDVLQSIAIAITISVILYLFIVTPNEVDGVSMTPNFHTGDLLFTSKLHKWFNGTGLGKTLDLEYDRGDVVVFKKPGYDDFVKRVIGLPGESISISSGVYYINGEPLKEFYDLRNSQKRAGTFLEDGADPITLGNDEYFLSGDNRDESFDSRSLGPIKEGWIKGKVIFRFWPLNQIGVINAGKQELGN
jgi:signal peptidase I